MLNKIDSKKAITQLVVISSLMIIGVLAVIYVQGWFYLYTDQVQVEVQAGDFSRDVDVLRVDGTILTVNNKMDSEIVLDSIVIGSNQCQIPLSSRTLSRGINSIDIGFCTLGMGHVSTQNVVLVSPQGIRSEDQIITNPPQGLFIVTFQNLACDASLNQFQLFTLSALENAHVSLDSDQDSFRACGRFLDSELSDFTETITLFYLGAINNSHVWSNNSMTPIFPITYEPVSVSYPSIYSSTIVVSSDNLASTHTCVGKILENNQLGSHFWHCNSELSSLQTIWLQMNEN